MSNFLKDVSGVPRGTAMALTDLPSIASPSFLGNISGSAATPSALTATQVTANLNIFTSSLQGLVPASGGGTTNFLRADGTWAVAGSGTVTAVSVATSNGFAGTSSGGATPALTLTTTITGVLKGNGTAISAATSGTDYSAGTSGLATGILKSTTGTGALTIATAADLPTDLTTKGDIQTFSTVPIRQAVPGDYGRLIPDSTQSTGWRSAPYNEIQQGRPGKNYIQYADFENNSTTGWTLGTVGTLTNGLPTGSPTFGSGASGNLSLSIAGTPIEGAFSLAYVSSAATTQGNMVASSSYAIDAEDQAKVLTIKFYYNASSGAANANFSGTSSNSYAWAVWDVTNSVWLSSAGNFNLVQSSGCGYVTGTCQTGATTANIRLVLYNANATSGAATLTLDGFYVGPQTAPIGPNLGDWNTNLSFIPSSGFGTPTNTKYLTRRVGDSLEFEITLTSGTVAAAVFNFGMPAGLTIDSSKMPSALPQPLGTGHAVNGTNSLYVAGIGLVPYYDGSDTANIYMAYRAANSTSFTKDNVSSVISSGNSVVLRGLVPITGWSSNSVASSDTDTRVVSASYYMSANSTPAAGVQINFDTKLYDTHGAVTTGAGAWKFTAPVTGIYQVGGTIRSSANNQDFIVYKNGTSTIEVTQNLGSNAALNSYNTTISLNAGDTVDLRSDGGNQLLGSGIPYTSIINISRLSGPAVITATESVNGRYFSSTTSISGSLATIVYATKGWDTHGAYNSSTGIWTAPVSGKYAFNAAIATAGTIALNNALDMQIQQTGSSSQISESLVDAAGAVSNLGTSVTDEFYCLAGDTIKVQVSSGAAGPSIVSSNSKNYFSWTRVGN